MFLSIMYADPHVSIVTTQNVFFNHVFGFLFKLLLNSIYHVKLLIPFLAQTKLRIYWTVIFCVMEGPGAREEGIVFDLC